jgi:adenine C2-methylase RlmN of 23S rRNA A2503 and tRNA A37
MPVAKLSDLKEHAKASFATNKNGAYEGLRFNQGATAQDLIQFYKTKTWVKPKTRVGESVTLRLAFPGYADPKTPTQRAKPIILKTITSFVKGPKRREVVASSQFRCSYACVTCVSAGDGINQSPEQIFLQIYAALTEANIPLGSNEPFSILLTGEGDDGVNAENIIEAIPHIKEAFPGLNFVRVSTAGAIAGIDKFAKAKLPEGVEMELQISLHATNDAFRQEFALRPENMTVAKLLAAGERYYKATGHRVRLNYLTFKRNLREEDAEFLKQLNPDIFYVALVPPNETRVDSPAWAKVPVSPAEIDDFESLLNSLKPDLFIDREIDHAAAILGAGCGQVTGDDPEEDFETPIIPLSVLRKETALDPSLHAEHQ